MNGFICRKRTLEFQSLLLRIGPFFSLSLPPFFDRSARAAQAVVGLGSEISLPVSNDVRVRAGLGSLSFAALFDHAKIKKN